MSFLDSILRRKAKATPVKPVASSRPKTSGTSVVKKPAEKAASKMVHGASALVKDFAEVSDFTRILTQGEGAVYAVPEVLSSHLIAMHVAARDVKVIRSQDVAASLATDLMRHHRTLLAHLRQAGYVVTQDLVATEEVIRQVRTNPGHRANSGAKGAPLELFEQIIDIGERAGASDIHFEVRGNAAMVRMRVDGQLEPLSNGNDGRYARRDIVDAIAAGFNSTRKGNTGSQYEESLFCDCMIGFDTSTASGQLRFQNLPGRLGPKCVVRILRSERAGESRPKPQKQAEIEWTPSAPVAARPYKQIYADAGYSPSQIKVLRGAAIAGKGMIVFAGITGSGKTTSLKAFIETMPGLHQEAIFTVEDPIEFEVHDCHQMEVIRDPHNEEETRRRYSTVFKALMRSDLDACSVGEARDNRTANFLLQMAETGHLGMGTVHVHMLTNIVPRLTNDDIGLNRQQLTNPHILNLLVYQALVPMLCPHCCESSEEASADPEVAELLEIASSKFRVPTDGMRFRHVGGCSRCKGRGTIGRRLVAEMFQPDRVWLERVRDGDDHGALAHYRSFSDGDLCSDDMTGKTVFEHALWRAIRGEIDPRECDKFETFSRFELSESTINLQRQREHSTTLRVAGLRP
jgi:type II secretory ATPase GspE/PulE/Tfp pilus assembly ATPase PilB-like protein